MSSGIAATGNTKEGSPQRAGVGCQDASLTWQQMLECLHSAWCKVTTLHIELGEGGMWGRVGQLREAKWEEGDRCLSLNWSKVKSVTLITATVHQVRDCRLSQHGVKCSVLSPFIPCCEFYYYLHITDGETEACIC